MVSIFSKAGFPKDNQLLFRVDYFIKQSPSEGGILVAGKDGAGHEYKPLVEHERDGTFVLPSGRRYSPSSVGNNDYPAIFFPFELTARIRYPEIVEAEQNAEFFKRFDVSLFDGAMQKIPALDAEVEAVFKEVAVWGAFELAGQLRNHFWGEMYRTRTPALEAFLENYRAQ